MFSDTHFHFEHFCNAGINGSQVLEQLAARNCQFGLDIGTESNDLEGRMACIEKAIASIPYYDTREKCRKFIYFAAGIWPSVEEIQNRFNSMKTLQSQIENAQSSIDQDTLHRKIIAIGECGLDHHWNPAGVDGRCESDFDQKMFDGERELFELQLDYAKKLNLPVIVHSRDAFQDTYDCIKNSGWNKGIIHCFSYGKEEAEKFLDLGWYISFSGSITYTKKSKMELMEGLVKSIPAEKILCETDSPYLAPVPFRGQTNTPVLVNNTYDFAAKIRGITSEELSSIVDSNIKTLFNLTV